MKLWWIDLETTGLFADRHEILEVAVAIADLERPFAAYDAYHAIVKFDKPDSELDSFIVNMHTKNRLLDECRTAIVALTCQDIETALLKLIPPGLLREDMPVLAGSSVHFDRSFLKRYMPDLEQRFNHRHYDVSSIKLFCESLGMPKLPRAEAHRAIPDIAESIDHARRCATWLRRTEQ